MKNIQATITIMLVIMISGCASGQYHTTPPSAVLKVKNTILIERAKADVWAKFIPALAKSFYVVNNIDKDSGFINVSFMGDPEKYIDCGYYSGWVKDIHGKRTYEFPKSRAYMEYEAFENKLILRIHRRLTLEGRINITVEEAAPKQTLVTVNTKYILTKSGEVSHLVVDQNFNTRWVPTPINDVISFTTGSEASFMNDPNTCRATGLLEQEILELVK